MNDIITQKRDLSIDTAKGLLILMVIYAHCFTEGVLHDFIFSFHMPAFFIIAGLTGALSHEFEKPFGKQILHLLFTLGIPFLFFELLGVMQELIRGGIPQSWKGFLFNTVTLRCNNIVDWFLGTLLLAKILSISIYKLFSKFLEEKKAVVLYGLTAVSSMAAAVLIPRTSPYVFVFFRRILIALGFLSIGYICKPLLLKRTICIGAAAFAAAFLLSLLNTGYPDINELYFGHPIVFFCAALLGSYGILQISKLLTCRTTIWFGQNSLILMGTHIPILLLTRFVFGTTDPTVFHRIGDFALILILELPIVWFLQNTVPFIVGKKR